MTGIKLMPIKTGFIRRVPHLSQFARHPLGLALASAEQTKHAVLLAFAEDPHLAFRNSVLPELFNCSISIAPIQKDAHQRPRILTHCSTPFLCCSSIISYPDNS